MERTFPIRHRHVINIISCPSAIYTKNGSACELNQHDICLVFIELFLKSTNCISRIIEKRCINECFNFIENLSLFCY